MSTSELKILPEPSEATSRHSRQGYDLLQIRPLKAVVRWGGFPYAFQATLLAVFLAMAVFA